MYWFIDGTEEWAHQLPERDHLAMLFSLNIYMNQLPYFDQVRERISSEQKKAFDLLSIPEQLELLKEPILSDARTTSGQVRIIQHMQLIACFQDWMEMYQEFYRLDEERTLLNSFKSARDHWFSIQTFQELCEQMSEAGFDTKWALLDSKHHWRPNEIIEQDLDRIWKTLQNNPSSKPNINPNILFFRKYAK